MIVFAPSDFFIDISLLHVFRNVPYDSANSLNKFQSLSFFAIRAIFCPRVCALLTPSSSFSTSPLSLATLIALPAMISSFPKKKWFMVSIVCVDNSYLRITICKKVCNSKLLNALFQEEVLTANFYN